MITSIKLLKVIIISNKILMLNLPLPIKAKLLQIIITIIHNLILQIKLPSKLHTTLSTKIVIQT